MGKLIAKTAALTLACILAVLLVLFGVFSLFFPGVMVSLTDSLGLEGPCATYSISLYNRTGKADDLADALERSYAAEHYGDVAEYGVIFLNRVDFYDFCALRDESFSESDPDYEAGTYVQHVFGIVSVSLYKRGDAEEALSVAIEAMDENLPTTTAFGYLAVEAMAAEDREFCNTLLSVLEFQVDGDSHSALLELKHILEQFCAETEGDT